MRIIYIPKPVAEFYPVKYGLLYNWWAATDARNIAADGWHVPSDSEFTTLTTYLGGESISGGKLKETGIIYWNTPNTGATNEIGFNFRGAAYRSQAGIYPIIGQEGYLWSATSFSTDGAYFRYAVYTGINFSKTGGSKKSGYSIRLIKNSTTLTNGQSGIYTGNDGKVYRTICIGTQEWLSDNLAETKYRNGDWLTGFDGGIYTPITNANWTAKTTEACCAHNDDINNI